ncbi:MAG TPA: peptide transporter [Cyanothece sp. UBA12306]|nr:peptide transporter [Cyanothece sp. UBA12306]
MVNWSYPPENLTLTPSVVDLWIMSLQLASKEVEQRWQILNNEEQIKAKKFNFEKHKRRFIVARSTLKMILGQYLKIPPQKIKFDYSSRGKPRLSDQLGNNQLQFNTSHSEELAIYGVTLDRLIGVDIEYIRPMKDAKQLAKRFFCDQEYQQINNLTSPQLEKAFFQLWTGKEAYFKATGEGISGGLDQVQICLQNNPKLIALPPNQSKLNWFFSSFIPSPGYQGAIVVAEDDCQLNYWRLLR